MFRFIRGVVTCGCGWAIPDQELDDAWEGLPGNGSASQESMCRFSVTWTLANSSSSWDKSVHSLWPSLVDLKLTSRNVDPILVQFVPILVKEAPDFFDKISGKYPLGCSSMCWLSWLSGPGFCSCPCFHLGLGASDCSPGLAFCFTGPWTLFGSAARSSPTPRAKRGCTAHVFTAQGGTRRKSRLDNWHLTAWPREFRKKL